MGMIFEIILLVGVAARLLNALSTSSTSTAGRQYNVDVKRLVFDPSCASLFSSSTLELTKFNNSMSVISGNTTLIKEIPHESYVVVSGYQMSSDGNNYESQASIEEGDHVCNFIANDKNLMIPLSLASNSPTRCPISLGNYWINDFILDSESLPDQRPGREKWLFNVVMFSSNRTDADMMAKVSAYIEFPNKKNSRQT